MAPHFLGIIIQSFPEWLQTTAMKWKNFLKIGCFCKLQIQVDINYFSTLEKYTVNAVLHAKWKLESNYYLGKA